MYIYSPLLLAGLHQLLRLRPLFLPQRDIIELGAYAHIYIGIYIGIYIYVYIYIYICIYPCSFPVLINFSAFGPCPCPSEI